MCAAVAEAQQTGKIFRIGYLDGSTVSGSAVLFDPSGNLLERAKQVIK